MESFCPSQEDVLKELERIAPDAPFLALGQTVFWDEPMKAGVALASRRLGHRRRFIAGVHDTDYFAKFAHAKATDGYAALPHNDTSTKGLWSAAGEFSALFGSETVVSRDMLQAHGAKVARIVAQRPGYVDEVTEAWGWRGVVSLGAQASITAEKPLDRLFPVLYDTFDWAVSDSLARLSGTHRTESEAAAEMLRALVCNESDGPEMTLGQFYRRLLPRMYDVTAGEKTEVEVTASTELLRLGTDTASLPRFRMLDLFLNPKTRAEACAAYDAAIAGSEMYQLERFGVGAVPFDVFVPGVGRGTLRLGNKGGVVMTPSPVGFGHKRRIESVDDLAVALEARFGPNCVVIGKAVALVGMLAAEFVLVFHEGASGYVGLSRDLHGRLAMLAPVIPMNPILRVKYEPWDALGDCCAWLKLPEPLRRPFGVEELSAPSFAARWREVGQKQRDVLAALADLRRPLDLIRFLGTQIGGSWACLASEYEAMHDDMVNLRQLVAEVRRRRAKVVSRLKAIRAERQQAERKKGEHWRARIFEKNPTGADLAQREKLAEAVRSLDDETERLKVQWRALVAEQEALVSSDSSKRARERRRNIAFEAELMRLQIIREAVISTTGLAHAGHRPAAWWFPLVCPDGAWFRATMRSAEYRLEPVQ